MSDKHLMVVELTRIDGGMPDVADCHPQVIEKYQAQREEGKLETISWEDVDNNRILFGELYTDQLFFSDFWTEDMNEKIKEEEVYFKWTVLLSEDSHLETLEDYDLTQHA